MAPLPSLCSGQIGIVLPLAMLAGCQSPNIFTAMNDTEASSTIQPASATSQPAGLPTPTKASSSNSTPSVASVDEHLRLGELKLEQGDYAQAQSHFDQVLQAHPDHVKANHRLGVLSDKLGQYLQAEEFYRTALEKDPRNAALLSDLGYSYWLQGRYSESERFLLEARRFDPNYEKAIANLGLLYGSLGRREEAQAMFARIGDEAEVQQIMQQIAGTQFPSPQPQAAGPLTAGRQTSVVTTQASAQHAAQALPQEMNAATREFVEQMRLAREELRRAEERLARQQMQGTGMPQQPVAAAAESPQQPAWGQPAVTSHTQRSPAPQRTDGTPIAGSSSQQVAQDSPLAHAALANRMAAIDSRTPQPTPGRPVIIGAAEPTAVAAHGRTWSTGTQEVVQSNASFPAGGSPQQPSLHGSENRQQSELPAIVPTTPEPWPLRVRNSSLAQSDQRNEPAQYQSHLQATANAVAQPSGSPSATSPRSGWGGQFAGSFGQSSAQWSASPGAAQGVIEPSTIQQGSASGPRYAQRPVEHAYHTQQSGQRPDISLAGRSGPSGGSLVPPSLSSPRAPSPQQSSIPSTPRHPPLAAGAYEQARKQAALLGLGAGPGQVFPYIQQTPRAMPGTDSRLNGAEYPAPIRHMPGEIAPPGQHAGSHDASAFHSPPATNSSGRPMPPLPTSTGDPMANPNAWSSTYHQQQPYTRHAPPPQTTPYQDTRVRHSAQLNGLINQSWGQSPQSPPYGVAAPSMTDQYAPMTTHPSHPAAASTSWNQHHPAPAAGPGVTVRGSATGSTDHSTSSGPPGPHGVPELYRSTQAASVDAPTSHRQGQQPYPHPAAHVRPYEGPVIVPAHR